MVSGIDRAEPLSGVFGGHNCPMVAFPAPERNPAPGAETFRTNFSTTAPACEASASPSATRSGVTPSLSCPLSVNAAHFRQHHRQARASIGCFPADAGRRPSRAPQGPLTMVVCRIGFPTNRPESDLEGGRPFLFLATVSFRLLVHTVPAPNIRDWN